MVNVTNSSESGHSARDRRDSVNILTSVGRSSRFDVCAVALVRAMRVALGAVIERAE